MAQALALQYCTWQNNASFGCAVSRELSVCDFTYLSSQVTCKCKIQCSGTLYGFVTSSAGLQINEAMTGLCSLPYVYFFTSGRCNIDNILHLICQSPKHNSVEVTDIFLSFTQLFLISSWREFGRAEIAFQARKKVHQCGRQEYNSEQRERQVTSQFPRQGMPCPRQCVLVSKVAWTV